MDRAIELPGSARAEPAGAQVVGSPDPDAVASVTLHLRPAKLAAEVPLAFDRFAAEHRLAINYDPARKCILLAGTNRGLSRAFNADPRIYTDGTRAFQAHAGPLRIPEALLPFTLAVLGLDQRPVVPPRRLRNFAAPAAGEGLWPNQIASLYGLDPSLDAPGQCVGIIALGGGYLAADLALAAQSIHRPAPRVIDCPVHGATNAVVTGEPADRELALDLQVIAALLPSSRIAVYFADNNIKSLADAIRQAIADDVNRPRVLSISWGSAEIFWPAQDRDALQSAFADAARLGITVVAAAGDSLATAGIPGDAAHVIFPASSPLVLACGGTKILLDAAGALAGETVWNEDLIGTGGGISDVFAPPAYQRNTAIPPSFNDQIVRRGIPDVAAASSRTPGYRIVLNGAVEVTEGTSAAAPLWASIVAMANARRGAPLGAIHEYLYANPALCRPIDTGNNRLDGVGYDAGPGWNACAGLGVPNELTVEGLASMPPIRPVT